MPPALRLALTLALPAAALLLARVPLMGLDLEVLKGTREYDPTMFGVFSLGVGPIISAALLVELAALLLPRWRRLRHGGYEGRARLWTRVRVLTLILAATQAFFVLRWMTSANAQLRFLPDGVLPRVLVMVVPTLGTFLLLWIAERIDRRGTGNGISVLIAAFSLPDLLHTGYLVALRFQDVEPLRGHLLLALMLVVGVVIAVGRRPARGWQYQPPRPELLVPASGVIPFSMAASLLNLPAALSAFVDLSPWRSLWSDTNLHLVLQVPLLAVLAAAFTRLFNRPARVAEVWRRGPGHLDEAAALAAARAAYLPGLGRALAILLALAFAGWLGWKEGVPVHALALVVLGCVGADVVTELRFRRAHGALERVWPVHRPYALGPALAGLAGAGIPAFPRALRHGALLSSWGPYVPVEILVPGARAEEAQALLRAMLIS